MRASVGDRITVVPNRMDIPARDGRIVEVRSEDGGPPYLVEWADNGHRGLLFPGLDAHLHHYGEPEPDPEPQPEPVRRRTWQVELTLVERGGQTTAHATLLADEPAITADGVAHLNPTDVDVPRIGDEVAAGRALKRLAEHLLSDATQAISATEGHRVPAIT